MKAIGFYQYLPVEDPASLVEVEVPNPEPGDRDLLVRVQAVSVNPVDVKIRSRLKKAAAQPQIIGWDVAGVVESIGRDVSLFKAGDEVYYAGDITRPNTTWWTNASSDANPRHSRLNRRLQCR